LTQLEKARRFSEGLHKDVHSPDAPETVHMDTAARLILVLRVALKADLVEHAKAVERRPGIDIGEVETVAVERGHDGRPDLADVLEPALDRRFLRGRVSGRGCSGPGVSGGWRITTARLKRTSSASLKIVNGPSYSGLGVYSKSSISSLTISRLVMR
jgi:hypothetical protein